MRRLLFALVGATATVTVCGLLVWHLYDWANTPLAFAEEQTYELTAGTTFSRFATELTDAGLLGDSWRFVALAKMLRLDKGLQAGEYRFDRGSSPRAILDRVVAGDVVLHQFRISEGAVLGDLLAQLMNDDRVRYSLDGIAPEQLLDTLNITWPYSEGTFFPDTYLIRRGESDRDILRRAHQVMVTRLDELWRNRRISTLSRPEAIILASIIEKETGRDADRARVSQVFHKRLSQDMPLQTDPTVIYALGETFDGNLTRAHLRLDSPYNTYRYKGLPPGAIAFPSSASLQAALNPAATDYLYFVARGDGSTQFSSTLAEHNAAVREFQLSKNTK